MNQQPPKNSPPNQRRVIGSWCTWIAYATVFPVAHALGAGPGSTPGAASEAPDPSGATLARWAFLLFVLMILAIGIVTVLVALWRVRVAKARARDNAPSIGASRSTSVDPWFESGQRAQPIKIDPDADD